jgi:hypothetical protein
VAKFEIALQSLKQSSILQLIREVEADRTLSTEARAQIINHPVGISNSGETLTGPPLAIYLRKDSNPWNEILRGFLALGADPNLPDSLRSRPLDIALTRSGNPEILKILVDCGAAPRLSDERFSIDIAPPDHEPRNRRRERAGVRSDPARGLVDFRALVDEVCRIYLEVSADNQRECRELIRQTGRLYDGYVYLRATEEATLISPEMEARTIAGKRFVELTSIILAGNHPRDISSMIHQIEDLMDNHSHLHHYHQSEPELALLLAHPGMDYTDEDDIEVGNTISRSLTSIHRIYFRGIHHLEAGVRETIGKLGFLTHSFKFYRFDTEQQKVWLGDGAAVIPASSIFERFGFERMPDRSTDRLPGEQSRDHLGRGYVITRESPLLVSGALARDPHLDPEFHIEFRRAYLLANHPKLGTLLIRNSSPLFGREAFPNFAYWGPTPQLTRNPGADLLHPEELIARGLLRPVLTTEGNDYKNISLGLIQSQSVTRLVNGIIAVKDALRRWKFDTDAETAWDVDPHTGNRYPSGSGMHLSDGFPTLVRHLVERHRFIQDARRNGHEAREQLPDLAFYHPYLPAWHPEKYTFSPRPGGAETTRSRLRLSGDILEGLQKLAAGVLRSSDVAGLERLGVMSFLMAGARAQAELVMIPRESGESISD